MSIDPRAENSVHTPLPDPPPDRILDALALSLITGMARDTIAQMAREGSFPRPVVLCHERVGWRESNIRAWVASRLHEPSTNRSPS